MSATKPLPDRIRQQLVDTGVMTTDGLGRKAQLRSCAACAAIVLVGLDRHTCALRAVCDPTALDQVGEAVALLSGRRTYALWGQELERRDRWNIAGGQPRPVIAEHRCTITTKPSDSILGLFIRTERHKESEAPF